LTGNYNNDNVQERMMECQALGEILYDVMETFAEAYSERGVGDTGGIMLTMWELVTKQLLANNVDGRRLRVILMELQDDQEDMM
tara:strand:+ start:1124 stop:1375 length:252 start_codon:yes stop_codon:yes gene_type:complete